MKLLIVYTGLPVSAMAEIGFSHDYGRKSPVDHVFQYKLSVNYLFHWFCLVSIYHLAYIKGLIFEDLMLQMRVFSTFGQPKTDLVWLRQQSWFSVTGCSEDIQTWMIEFNIVVHLIIKD